MPLRPSGIITLLTDFGHLDPFVGVMKGVILGRCRQASLVDLSHAVSPQDVLSAAWWWARCYSWFPAGTVHLAVVDPGVGSRRRACVMQTDNHWFVAPDNGLFDLVAARTGGHELRSIDHEMLGIEIASNTFHGRDLFAPVAAELAAGELSFARVGPSVTLKPSLQLPKPRVSFGVIDAQVLLIDRFGNLMTNIEAAQIVGHSDVLVLASGRRCPLKRTYSDVAVGRLVALVNSFGVLEIAVREGNASRELGLERGARVQLVAGQPR